MDPPSDKDVAEPGPSSAEPKGTKPTKSLCIYCSNMDVDQMICRPHGVYDISSDLGTPSRYEHTGYLHHPNYASLERSAASCPICDAMVLEIIRYLSTDITPLWSSRMDFIKSRLSSENSQLYLHFPHSKRATGRGIFISCWSGFVDSSGRDVNLRELGFPVNPDYVPDADYENGTRMPEAFVIGKIGMYFERLAPEQVAAARNVEMEYLGGKRGTEVNGPLRHFRLKRPPCGWEVHENPLSDAATETAHIWLNNCRQNHDVCQQRDLVPIMPTRLIDVGSEDPLRHPRLICTVDGEQYEYTALSHSWGGHVALITTDDTLEERKKEIPLGSFPPSFRDAVIFTRSLDLQYVWIDSLCIVQYNKQDWTSEARIMGDIFKNSTLTLSATTAKNSTVGFLHPRTATYQSIRLGHHSENPYLNTRIVLRPWLRRWAECIDGDMSPLSSRGWILQERLLPPRTLHFGAEQMFWECRGGLTQEAQTYDPILPSDDLYFDVGTEWELNKVLLFPEGSERRIKQVLEGERYKSIEKTGDDGMSKVHQNHHDNWFKIVENYSLRSLTHQTDKLVAISGAAQAMHRLLIADEYIAGAWKSQLTRGLIWKANGAKSRSEEYIAPSWSWASMMSGVKFPHDSKEELNETWSLDKLKSSLPNSATQDSLYSNSGNIYRVEIQLQFPDNPYGQLAEGTYLEISGLWIRICIERNEITPEFSSYESDPSVHASWATSILPGVDASNGRFTLVFSHDDSEPTFFADEDGNLYFPGYDAKSPHDNYILIGDAMVFELDMHLTTDLFEKQDSFYTFELQHVVGKYFLMVRRVQGDRQMYYRIGRAEYLQMPGNPTAFLAHLDKTRSIRII
ncbi:hypothetical protein BP6252_12454 [Coleophoma cylindrospora]|uniref:Heterokaryon incompatibility domain-containing protein n=1 Tax=Coleophoma cylindrospora TaxID=1849047 RepID=A0A3D8QH69_9HELO|nr:hypothetical protein BP6252_12454 [Coleophoma cylindrospora]